MTTPEEKTIHSIGIIGGTGKEGKGLAYCWAKAGYRVTIGSRQAEKAQAAAEEVRTRLGGKGEVTGAINSDAATNCDLATITVPYSAHRETLEGMRPYLQGKILIDVTVPLVPPRVSKVQMPPAGSASLEAQEILGEGVQVVTAFQNISYENLYEGKEVDCDVLVCSNSKTARRIVIGLVQAAGLSGFDAGPLANSMVVEGLSSVLIGINLQFGVQSSGIRITGIPRS